MMKILVEWRRKLKRIAKDVDQVMDFMDLGLYGYSFWTNMVRTLAEIDMVIDGAIDSTRKKMHGRERTELRKEFNEFTKRLEEERLAGRTGGMIRYLVGSKRGASYRLEELVVEGRLETDAAEIHRIGTENFRQWMARPACPAGTIGAPDAEWKALTRTQLEFEDTYDYLETAPGVLGTLWRSANKELGKDAMQFQNSVMVCPTYLEFLTAIKHTKAGSAPGPSGLTYNMLKALPERFLTRIYQGSH
jgi:hypothetical protein